MDIRNKIKPTLSFIAKLTNNCSSCGQKGVPLMRNTDSMTGLTAGVLYCPTCRQSVKDANVINDASQESTSLESLRVQVSKTIDVMGGVSLESLALELGMYRALLRRPSEMYLRDYLNDEVNQLDVVQLNTIVHYLQKQVS